MKLKMKDATELLALREMDSERLNELAINSIEQLNHDHKTINGACEILVDSLQPDNKNDSRPETETKTDRIEILKGIPISIKETIGIAGHSITAGSLRMPAIDVEEDAPVVTKLKAAGAVVVARSNLPEFAMTYDSENLLYGRTNNPLNETFSAGGSSGGEAALVSSGATVLGIGSDIGGSIRYPAHCCGVVGFKPESSAVDKTGTFPQLNDSFCDSMLAIGTLTRSVRDTRLVYDIISERPVIKKDRYKVRLLAPNDFYMKITDDVVEIAYESAKNLLIGKGYISENKCSLDIKKIYQAYIKLIVGEFEPLIKQALTDKNGKPFRPLKELKNQILGKPEVHPYVFWPLLGMSLIRPSSTQIVAAQKLITDAREKVRQLIGPDGILLLPTNGALAMKHGKATWKINRPWVQKEFTPTVTMNALDLPSISIPAKKFKDPDTGLIPGIMLACTSGNEDLLFSTAEILEAQIS